jgi:hypothetical protein
LRGIGYLYERHGVILAGCHAITTVTTNNTKEAASIQKHSVHIYNMQESKVNCSDIVIWVRVNGTEEIFAGQAQPVHTSMIAPASLAASATPHKDDFPCHWEFDFDATKSGPYNIDAKLMEWKPNVPRPITCPIVTTNASIVKPFPIVKSFLGFKMYRPEEMCCEICSRLQGHCMAWATPIPAFPRGGDRRHKARRGCELYFENETSFGIIPTAGEGVSANANALSPMLDMLNRTGKAEFYVPVEQHSKKTYGFPHHNATSHFIGCGWSYWFTLDYPCLSGALDDSVFFANNVVHLTGETDVTKVLIVSKDDKEKILAADVDDNKMIVKKTATAARTTTTTLGICTIDSESFGKHSGRWVRDPWPSEEECPHPYSSEYIKNGNLPVIYGHDIPNCMRRDDLSQYDQKCIEVNCDLIQPWSKWVSPLHEEKQWYGHWKHDSGCTYSQYTEIELQQCIDRRKLYGFKVEGQSIASMIRTYLGQRFQNITLYDNDGNGGDGTKVTISTFGLLHYCNVPDKVKAYFQEGARNITETEEFIWVSGYFLSSEREILCTASRMREYSVWGDEFLTPKGYKMINAYDMTAAMTYDTASQHDGMHIAGPPMMMILTKMFHYLCSS